MNLYSYKGKEPEPLPFRIVLDDGTSKTSLNELSNDELKQFGFILVKKPKFNEEEQKIIWNGEKYKIINLSENEISEIKLIKTQEEKKEKIKKINYESFLNDFIKSDFYKKLRICVSKSNELNLVFSEFIFHLNNIKDKEKTSNIIQEYINIFFLCCEFNQNQLKEIKTLFKETGLIHLYYLPSKGFLKENFYNFKTHCIMRKSPFKSWVLTGDLWKPPINYPVDGNIYKWGEDEYNKNKNGWILVNSK